MIPLKPIKKIVGPTLNKFNGRYHVILYYEDKTCKITPYARNLLEQHLGRQLEADEEVDHINDNKIDNRLENLQVLSKKENWEKWAKKNREQATVDLVCIQCGKPFELLQSRRTLRTKQNTTWDGLCCSKQCSATMLAAIRWPQRMGSYICPICNTSFTRKLSKIKDRARAQPDGWKPTCGRACGRQLQLIREKEAGIETPWNRHLFPKSDI